LTLPKEIASGSEKAALRALFSFLLAVLLLLVPGCGGRPDPEFHRPNVIAGSPDNSFLVVNDIHAKRLLVLDRSFRLIREITHPFLDSAWGIAVTDKEIIVCNFRSLGIGRTREEKDAFSIIELLFFDYDGGLKKSFPWPGRKGPVKSAGAFFADTDGSFLVVDSRQNCLVKIASDGKPAGFIATYGVEPGKLFYPNDVRKTIDGKILVVDEYNSRLQLFEPDGRFIRVAVERGEEPGKVGFPQSAAQDSQGNIYCTELSTMRVSVFDPQFRLIREMFPPRADEKELFQLFGICVLASPTETIVVDSLGSKLFVFDEQGKYKETIDKCRFP